MLCSELVRELELCLEDNEAVIEVDGVQHTIHEVHDTSQGPVLIVDTTQEDLEMVR